MREGRSRAQGANRSCLPLPCLTHKPTFAPGQQLALCPVQQLAGIKGPWAAGEWGMSSKRIPKVILLLTTLLPALISD